MSKTRNRKQDASSSERVGRKTDVLATSWIVLAGLLWLVVTVGFVLGEPSAPSLESLSRLVYAAVFAGCLIAAVLRITARYTGRDGS